MTRRAFTLLELLMAMAISGVVLAGICSALLAAARALPPKSDPVAASLTAAEAVNMLTDDLRFATSITAAAADAVQFTVPDRNSDGAPETIRYEWKGAGRSLLRTVNGTQVTLLDSVASFQLRYTTSSVTETRTTITTSPETLLASFDGWSGVTATTGLTAVSPTAWAAEYFALTAGAVPRAASGFRFTRVRAVLQRSVATGSISVGIHRATGGGAPEPPTDPMATPAIVSAAALPAAAAWFDIPLPVAPSVTDRQSDFVLVIQGLNGASAGWGYYYASGAPKDTAPIAIWSTDSGRSWDPGSGDLHKTDHRFEVYGVYELSASTNAAVSRIQAVEVLLNAPAVGPALAGGVRLHNQPEAP